MNFLCIKKCIGYNWIKNILNWLTGTNPQGIGTLLIGIGAILALVNGADLLNKVLEIKNQAKKIETAVSILNSQSQKISSAIDLLGNQLKELKASQTVEASAVLKSVSPTKDQIKEAISKLPLKSQPGRSSIYLPPEKINETVELIYKEKLPAARAIILQNSLEYNK